MKIQAGHTIPKFYYYITPLFILLDYFGGLSVRAAVLDSMPMYKNLYYGFCIFCAVIIFFQPRFTAVVTLFESMIIVLITVLSVFLPYVRFIMQADDVLNESWNIAGAFSAPKIANLMLAGTMAIIAFHSSINALSISKDKPGPDSSK